MTTVEEVEREFTLQAAVARYDELRMREATGSPPLDSREALEMLALGEVIARKAHHGRQLSVRSARAAGASWSQIGAAMGTTKQSAWEAYARWIDGQEDLRQQEAADARRLVQVEPARK